MALLCSRIFAQRQISGSLFRGIINNRSQIANIRAATRSAIKEDEDFDAKNARLGRPQSPHLTIYKPQLTSLLSLSHRATGMAMGGIVILWGLGGLVYSGHFPETLASLQSMHLSPALVLLGKTVLAFPISYHYANGIRHLMWDLGKFLTIKEVYLTGYAVLGVSAVLTAILISL